MLKLIISLNFVNWKKYCKINVHYFIYLFIYLTEIETTVYGGNCSTVHEYLIIN
jgi:hypothetical protein